MSEDFSIEKGLTDTEKSVLHDMMRTPGWKVLIRLVDRLQFDWAEQIMSKDYGTSDNQKIIQDLMKKQGMRNGLVQFFRALQIWKRARDKELDKDNE